METDPRPRLPVEVCERIIEHVYSSRQDLIPAMRATLCNCALVCRAFFRPAASVLWRDLDEFGPVHALFAQSPGQAVCVTGSRFFLLLLVYSLGLFLLD